MTGWSDLVSAALLGTQRQPPDLSGLPAPVLAAAERLPAGDPDGRLLGAAALAVSYRRAGQRAGAAGPLPPPAPADTAPPPAAAAAGRLAQLLAANETELAVEWLGAAVAAGRRAPVELLPALLDAAARRRALRPALAPALGRRGEWLAGFRDDWRQALAEYVPALAGAAARGDPDVWRLGEPAARRAYLGRLRAEDPDAARGLITDAWQAATATERAGFLGVLETGLSAADEPLLEQALDDRGRQVRATAAALLSRLPAAAYGQRMAARLRAWIRPERRPSGTRVRVTPPAECDESMLRDGVVPTPPRSTIGPRAWWLRQVVAAAPLATWRELLGSDPAGTVALPVEDDWAPLLRAGWSAAAIQQRDAEWAAALLPAADTDRLGLLGMLPAAARAGAVAGLLRKHPIDGPGGPDIAPAVLAACPGPWPPVLAAVVLDQLRQPSVEPWRPGMPEVLRLAGRRLPVDAAARVTALAARQPAGSPWPPALLGVADLLTARHEMHREIHGETP
jgi:hypothetical protein